jgi:GNAT superfamily N-acetyltransferase
MSGPCNEPGSSIVPALVEVRDFTPADQATVRALVLAGLADHWGEVDASLNPDLDDIAAAYAGGCTLVAEVDGAIVGTGTVVPRDALTAEIVRMSVARAARGRGIGRLLVDRLARRAADLGATRLVLETTADWHDTVAFYRSCGFEITHYDDGRFGRDAWFERRLSEDAEAEDAEEE